MLDESYSKAQRIKSLEKDVELLQQKMAALIEYLEVELQHQEPYVFVKEEK